MILDLCFNDLCHGSLENKPLLSRMQNEPYPYLIPGL